MKAYQTTLLIALVTLSHASARADSVWIWTNSAVGEGLAQVFDGGPAVMDSVDRHGTVAPTLAFRATDATRPSSLGALASANGESFVGDFGRILRVMVDFSASYASSLSPGGDRPGGRAEGMLTSVVEFVMPVDELDWFYGLGITEDVGFEGASSVVVENMTQTRTLLTLTSEMGNETILEGHAGDLIRITSQMSGRGDAPGGFGILQNYSARLDMIFTIPEPSTALLLLGGLLVLQSRK